MSLFAFQQSILLISKKKLIFLFTVRELKVKTIKVSANQARVNFTNQLAQKTLAEKALLWIINICAEISLHNLSRLCFCAGCCTLVHFGLTVWAKKASKFSGQKLDGNKMFVKLTIIWLHRWLQLYHCTTISTHQACTTYGPRAKCCPRKLLIWPAKPKMLCF